MQVCISACVCMCVLVHARVRCVRLQLVAQAIANKPRLVGAQLFIDILCDYQKCRNMVQPPNAKQSSILDFFKRKNGFTEAAVPSSSGEDNKSAAAGTSINHNANGKNVNKRVFETTDSELIEAKATKFSFVDVNFIDANILDISINIKNDDESSFQESGGQNENYSFTAFRSIVRSVLSDQHFAYLFDEQDWKIVQNFTCMPGPTQLLYIKLYMRKRAWIPISAIKYPEIDRNCNHMEHLSILNSFDFLDNSSKFKSVDEALQFLSLSEMKCFLKFFPGFNFTGSKVKTIPLFINYIKTSRILTSEPSETMEDTVLNKLKKFLKNKCFKINETVSKVWERIFILYYCPEYLLERIRKQNDFQWIFGEYNVSTESYPVLGTNKKQIIYSSRNEFIEFSNAFDLTREIITKLNQKSFIQIVEVLLPIALNSFAESFDKWHEKDSKLSSFLLKYSATGMYLRAIHECLSALEKLRNYQQFVDIVTEKLLFQTIYGVHYRGRWYLRAALISQSHLKNIEQAILICCNALEDVFIRSGNRLEIFNRLIKLIKIEKEDLPKLETLCPDYYCLDFASSVIDAEYRNIENDSSFKNFFSVTLANGEVSLMSVENIVINHYLKEGFAKGIHCESSIYHSILGLLFWDLIYSTRFDDSFRYHKQMLPLDLNYDSFYEQRKSEIDERIQKISKFSEDDLISEITFSWHQHQEKASSLINWDKIELENLLEITTCLGADKIAIICHFLIFDFKHLHKGFPDLIVWNHDTRKIKLIEVKSHHDHLSPTQSIWLSYLHKFGLDVELCHVKPKKKS